MEEDIELIKLQNSLIDIITEFDGDADELSYFESQLCILGLDLSYLYRSAVFHKKYLLSDLILGNSQYNINADNNFKSEVILWSDFGRDDCIIKCIDDGYFPQLMTTLEIMRYLEDENQYPNTNVVFQKFLYIFKIWRIKKFYKNIIEKKQRMTIKE